MILIIKVEIVKKINDKIYSKTVIITIKKMKKMQEKSIILNNKCQSHNRL